MPLPPLQIFCDSVTSSSLRAESEPAKATWPWLNLVMPPPEPMAW